jgi:NTE family protein
MRKYSALVLQGGGFLGAYECGVIRKLCRERASRTANGSSPLPFDVVTGVSIGAVNAAVLVGYKDAYFKSPVEAVDELWKLLAVPSILGIPALLNPGLYNNSGMYSPNPLMLLEGPLMVSNWYDTSRLRDTLDDLVDWDKLEHSKTHLIVTATDVATGELARFGNRASRRRRRNPDERVVNTAPLTADHILASGSLPPSFPMTRVGDSYYWDGGLVSNLPLQEAINSLEQMGDPDDQREVIAVELFPKKGETPHTIFGVLDRVFELAFCSKLDLDKEFTKKYSDNINLAAKIKALLKALESQTGDIRSAADAVQADAAYQRLLQHRAITLGVMTIDELTKETVAGPADCTSWTVDRRIEAGEQSTYEIFR